MKVAYKKNRAKLMFFSQSIIIQPIPLHFTPSARCLHLPSARPFAMPRLCRALIIKVYFPSVIFFEKSC